MRLPNVLIIGAAKSGTTSLAVNLGAHPDVYMAYDELHYFNDDVNWQRGRSWYEEKFAKARSEQIVAEKTPGYLFDPRVPDRIATTLPDPRSCAFVAILREPTARALSDVEHRRRLGKEHRSPAMALRQNLRGELGPLGYDYLGMGSYAEQLQRYRQRFGPSQVHVEFYEDLVEDPGAVYRRLFSRLGLADFAGFDEGTRANESARIRYPRVYRALLLLRAGHWLPPPVGRWIWTRLQEPTRYEPLPDDLRADLRAHYAPRNAELAQLLGRGLPAAWTDDR